MKEYDNYDFNDDLGYEEIDDEDYYQDQHYGNGEFYGNDDMNPGMSNNQKINMGLNVDRLSFDDIEKHKTKRGNYKVNTDKEDSDREITNRDEMNTKKREDKKIIDIARDNKLKMLKDIDRCFDSVSSSSHKRGWYSKLYDYFMGLDPVNEFDRKSIDYYYRIYMNSPSRIYFANHMIEKLGLDT